MRVNLDRLLSLLGVFLIIGICPVIPAQAWFISENGSVRPLLLRGPGDVSSADLPSAIQSSMRVDALARTIEWSGDRGTIRAIAGERIILKNGVKHVLSRAVRMAEFAVVFPEEILKIFPDIFSFVELASAADGDVLNVGSREPPAVSPGIRPALESTSVSADTSRARPIRVVVIDPGHGGSDPGAKGKSGAVEKDIVLGVAFQLARMLEEADKSLKVVLTRSRDEFISLQERARISNTRRGDLYVSIHANSVRRNEAAAGFEVYHLDLDGANDDARALAAIENAEPATADRAAATPTTDLGRILGDVMQLQYLNASLELSKHVTDGLSASLEGASKNRGSKGAFFYVLKDVMAPAILVEIGFVTNEWESSFLQKPWYQRKIAEGLMNGILNFKRAENMRFHAAAPTDTPSDVPPAPESGR